MYIAMKRIICVVDNWRLRVRPNGFGPRTLRVTFVPCISPHLNLLKATRR